MASDERGLFLTGATSEQASEFDSIVRDYLTYRTSTFPRLEALCDQTPNFAMAQMLKAFLQLSIGSPEAQLAAKTTATSISKLQPELSAYEGFHYRALNAWLSGNTLAASRFWDEAMFLQPLDILALKLQHSLLFWSGHTEHMRDAAARALAAWNAEIPGFAHVQAIMAFALEETGNYASAEKLGRDAHERCPEDLWAIHAVSHVYEMQGKLNDGIKWLDYPIDAWEDRNPFKAHLRWHASLFAVEKGDFFRALELYDQTIDPDQSTFYLDMQNAASLLARLEFAGVDTGDRWQGLAAIADQTCQQHLWMFTEPHRTMALAKNEQFSRIQDQLDSLEKLCDVPDHSSASLIQPLLIPLCTAIKDFYQGDFISATKTMMNLRYDYQCLGGSHAQRDVFAIYLIDAAIKSDNLVLAKALLTERVTRHPNSYSSWKSYSEVCKRIGDNRTARYAKHQVGRISGALATS